MHPLGITKIDLTESEMAEEISALAKKLGQAVSPVCAILFGSAASGRMTNQSDLDVLLVFKDLDDLRGARAAVAKVAPLSSYPVDLVYMLLEEYLRKREIGGVSMIAHEEGLILLGEDPK